MSKMSNIYSIYVFYKVCKALNYREVSKDLNITVSSISQHIKKIESYFSKVLLIRTTRVIKLTSDGEFFFHMIKGNFENIEKSIGFLEKKNITICGTSSLTLELLTSIINNCDVFLNNLTLKHIDQIEYNEDFIISYGDVNVINQDIYTHRVISLNDTLSMYGTSTDSLENVRFILVNNRFLIRDFEYWCENFNVDINRLDIISVFNVKQAVMLLRNGLGNFVANKNIMLEFFDNDISFELSNYECESPSQFHLYRKKDLSQHAENMHQVINKELTRYFGHKV
jgi:DNA-binding transcriptional LysR family regulator